MQHAKSIKKSTCKTIFSGIMLVIVWLSLLVIQHHNTVFLPQAQNGERCTWFDIEISVSNNFPVQKVVGKRGCLKNRNIIKTLKYCLYVRYNVQHECEQADECTSLHFPESNPLTMNM